MTIKTIFKLITLSTLGLFLYSGCNSAIYEIIEVEEPVEIKEEKTEVAEIKEEIKEESKEEPKEEIKFSDNQQISTTFAIQIGAFDRERNATKFTNKARTRLTDHDIYYKDVEGLYKVRLSTTYNSFDEALVMLKDLWERGFSDSFIVRLTYYKSEK